MEHISPVLASLHWLPVEYCVKFKVSLCVYKGLYGRAPEYISDLLVHQKCSRPLRSSNYFDADCAMVTFEVKRRLCLLCCSSMTVERSAGTH